MSDREKQFAHAVSLWQEGRALEALAAFAQVGREATDVGDWTVALHAHRLTAEIWFHLGEFGHALSHAAEALYLSLEHRPHETLASLGQILAFVEELVTQRLYGAVSELGLGLAQVLETLQPHPEAEGWWHLARDLARLFQLVGEAAGSTHHPAFVEAMALAALLDRATEGHLQLKAWIHQQTGPSNRPQ